MREIQYNTKLGTRIYDTILYLEQNSDQLGRSEHGKGLVAGNKCSWEYSTTLKKGYSAP